MKDGSYRAYSDWKGWEEKSFGFVSLPDACYFELELKASKFEVISDMRVVEIGFGNASFASWSKSHGADYAGVEMLPELVEFGRIRGIETHLSNVPLQNTFPIDSVDLIVAFDVLEHMDIHQLKEFFRDCRKILRPGATLIARVPSGDSPFSRAIQYGDITHQCVLGSSAVRQLCNDAGLEVCDIRSPAFPIWGLGPFSFVKRVTVKLFRLFIHAFIANILMGKSEAVLSPNMVFVLKKCE